MKVILLQFVRGVGEKGDIVEVSDGYAQNALMPRGLAKAATNTAVNKIQQDQASQLNKAEKEKERTLDALMNIQGKTVVIKEKLNEKGSLYHALGLKEIIRAVHDQLGISTPNNLYTEKYALKESG
ncbi:MAG: large subunit ribosomal protein L9, partial [Candidatus Paceibacteria bacterium]